MATTFLMDQSISVRVPAETTYLEFIRYVISGAARRAGFSEEDTAKIEMAIDEVCTNAMIHAHDIAGKDPSQNRLATQAHSDASAKDNIDLHMSFDGEKIVITVVDKGKPFSPIDFKAPDIREYLSAERGQGLGIYIMKTFMDQVEYDYQADVGNRLSLVKYLETSQE